MIKIVQIEQNYFVKISKVNMFQKFDVIQKIQGIITVHLFLTLMEIKFEIK